MSNIVEIVATELSSKEVAVETLGKTKVLVVDDVAFDRKVLQKLINECGYSCVEAKNGEQAVELFEIEKPDIVLMDINMPRMGGKEAAARIKSSCERDFIPIIFITGLNQDDIIVDCMNTAGEDVLVKPYNAALLKAKIGRLLRTREMYSLIKEQNEELEKNQVSNMMDAQIAKKLISNISRYNELSNFQNIKYTVLPVDILSGDIILATRTPDDGQAFLLGDFTGHGLPAAIGAMVVSEIFYSMNSKGFLLGDIANEINRKLHSCMPTGRFMAASLLHVHPDNKSITVVNAGLPDIFICSEPGKLRQRVSSSNVAMGILSSEVVDIQVDEIEISKGDRIYVHSDGLIETSNSLDEHYGMKQLSECIENSQNSAFDNILTEMNQFRGEAKQLDDISLLEIRCNIVQSEPKVTREPAQISKAPMSWGFEMKLSADMLQETNPVPVILHTITELQGMTAQRENLYTIISELYSNALEHGVLDLSSELKAGPEGFVNYYNERTERLKKLEDGDITMNFTHTPTDNGGRLTIKVTDSGRGFDHSKMFSKLSENSQSFGRGIALVRVLTDSLEYTNEGKSAEIQYNWSIN